MMLNNYVGAGILNIITESLYDNPIVVFREYVQNSVDSIFKEKNQDNYEINIEYDNNNLYFFDNASGINSQDFLAEMLKIGNSSKKKLNNLGYKGIGRLSGVPYCRKLYFLNINDFSNNQIQMYTIDSSQYDVIKNNEQDTELSFNDLMNKIGNYEEYIGSNIPKFISDIVKKYDNLLSKTNTGFIVILQEVSSVLKHTIDSENFFINLQWLLPVDFDDDLYNSKEKELFDDLTKESEVYETVPIKYCKISYNNKAIHRPIKKEMFRDYICKNNFKYAVGFHTFKCDKIFIDKTNIFSGIRLYIDNMLLCDEDELLQNLNNFGLLQHTLNGQIQSVRGIGAMIYITDKVNISANARRTFIEVTDNNALEFLKLLAEFINTIYDTRYALSNYVSAKLKQDQDQKKIEQLKKQALDNLRKLATEDIELSSPESEISFNEMSSFEKKKAIKSKISNQCNKKIKEYIKQCEYINLETAFVDFIRWLNNGNNLSP